MTYSREDAQRIVSDNDAFLDWVEHRLEAMGFRAYGEVELIFQEDGRVYITWRDPWDDYENITIDWKEIYDETGETFRKAQEERKRIEEEKRAQRERDRQQSEINFAINNLNKALARAGNVRGSLVADRDGNYRWV